MEIDWRCHPCDEKHIYNYVDILLDTNEVIYVGKGPKPRVLVEARNDKHSNYVRKHGFRRVVVACFDDDESARANEISLIEAHKTFYLDNERGCNFTRGGDGTAGHTPWNKGLTKDDIFTEESLNQLRQKVSASLTGRKLSEINKMRIGQSNSGKVRTEETKKKIAATVKETMLDPDIREKCKAWQGKHLSDSHKRALSKPYKGKAVICNDGIAETRYKSAREAERKIGLNYRKILECCHGRLTIEGFAFKFDNPSKD